MKPKPDAPSARELAARGAALKSRGHYLAGRVTAYSDEFYAPRTITRALGEFDLDPCAGPSRHARRNIRAPRDGLAAPWSGRVWLNPPYSNIHDWLARFVEHGNGIALVNARCETKWFQRIARHASAILFPAGRIEFERPGKTESHPPCGSALIAIGKRNAGALFSCGIEGLALVPGPANPITE